VIDLSQKIILPGGAGLVGQNLVACLKKHGYKNIVVLDKHLKNLEILKEMHPDVIAECVDLAEQGDWGKYFVGANAVVILQAQIGGLDRSEFIKNNVVATVNILNEIKLNKINHVVHISSSVVMSRANDFYTETKKIQEKLVMESGVNCPILRPTLMFGWFDRKHLSWLSRLMTKIPLFPIPGDGRFLRQPLYVGDFCQIIISCIKNNVSSTVFNISGLEKIDYIDIIKKIRSSIKAKAIIIKVPYSFFYGLLWTWSLFDKDPPFTIHQLEALVIKEEFEIIDWPLIFNIKPTSFSEAIDETYNHPIYSKVVLDF
jgi:nucleoside-diphosphate-sugar epimerase